MNSPSLDTAAMIMPAMVFFGILLIIYFLVLKMNKSAVSRFGGKHIRFIERVSLGWDRTILILEIDSCYYIIYSDKNGMTLIDKRDDLSIDDYDDSNSFKNVLSKLKSSKKTDEAI